MPAAGTITPWDEFWDSYFEWELEPVDDTVRIRTDLAAVSEDSTSFMGCRRGCVLPGLV